MDKESFFINRMHSEAIGDDAAVMGAWLYSADAFFEDTHFKRTWMTPEQIGRKAMLVNLSDAVAMAAYPRYALVTAGIPPDMSEEALCRLAEGLRGTAAEYDCEIIGGDTVKSDKLHLSITIVSYSEHPLLRSGIQEGDLLAFTGHIGRSARNLEALFRGESLPPDAPFFEPVLRSRFVYEARPFLRAGMDISDGLFCDTNKLLDTNKTGLEPLMKIDERDGLGGEDYEMLVAFDPKHEKSVREIARRTDTPLNVFARIRNNRFRFPCKSHHFP
jgi:thiamine-monophosphate kinase